MPGNGVPDPNVSRHNICTGLLNQALQVVDLEHRKLIHPQRGPVTFTQFQVTTGLAQQFTHEVAHRAPGSGAKKQDVSG